MSNSKKVTMADIANELDVSINAVSLALNNKSGVSQDLKEKIVNLANDLGYFEHNPKYKQSVKTRTLCLITRRRYFSSSNFYSEVILGIQEEAALQKYSLLVELSDADENINELPLSIQKNIVRAVIILGPIDDDYLKKIVETGIPIILVDTNSSKYNLDSIMSANLDGTYQATKYLLSKGYKDIGFIGDIAYSVSFKERFRGVIDAINDTNEDFTFKDSVEKIIPYSILYNLENYVIAKDRSSISKKVFSLKKLPEVFICSNDELAILLSEIFQSKGLKIPDDISICGFDNIIDAGKSRYDLTTVNVSKKALGREAVRRLIWIINNPNAKSTRTSIETELIVRGSTF